MLKDERFFLSGGEDGEIKLWDLGNKTCLAELTTKSGAVGNLSL
jgi:WD40 repeat protein